MAPSKPQISVIVPVYNVQDHIGACIDSLKAQSFIDFEAIVIDDGSYDDSPARLRAAVGEDPRFQVIRQDNAGLSAARNTGLEIAQGDFIAFLDGDDAYDPAFLERMHDALTSSTADWVACGLRNMHPDGVSTSHSALYDAPNLPQANSETAAKIAPRLWPLSTWSDVIAHYPSAWNKLYRRSLIDGLRFDPGTWFEDHTFFCRVAARTSHLLHLPQPLYLQTRGRIGQITATDSDRVFEQFAVLEALYDLFKGRLKPGGAEASAVLAHRLIHERSTVLRDPKRRARFLFSAREWLTDHDLPLQPTSSQISSWALELAGTCPLSVVIPWDGQDAPLHVTLGSLAQAHQSGAEILIVTDDTATAAHAAALADQYGVPADTDLCAPSTGDAGAARNAGLTAARGEMIVFVDAGDALYPETLIRWTDEMLRAQADFGISQFRVGVGIGDIHTGIHDTTIFPPLPRHTGPLSLSADQALSVHRHPTAKIYRRQFLHDCGLAFGNGPQAPWQITLGAALHAKKVIYFPWAGVESGETPEARALWHRAVPAPALARTFDIEAPWTQALPIDWQRRLFARALWEGAHFAHMSRPARLWFLVQAAILVRQRDWHRMQGPLDPDLGWCLLRLMGQPTQLASPNSDRP